MLIIMQLYHHYDFLIINYDNFILKVFHLKELISQLLCFHYHPLVIHLITRISSYLDNEFININHKQFILYYLTDFYHDTIFMEFLFHFMLITLQQFIHIYFIMMDYDKDYQMVLYLTQLITLLMYFHLNQLFYHQLSNFLVFIYYSSTINFKLFHLNHYIILDHVTIIMVE